MRIENLFTQTPFSNSRISSQKDEKTKVVAREVLASLPSIGLDPVSTIIGAVTVIAVGFLTRLITETGGKITENASNDIAEIVYPSSEKNPFMMKKCLEAYHHSSWTQEDLRKKKLPDPIFESRISEILELLRKAPKEALDSKAILPSAIISGPWGTGKTTAFQGIARGGDWNYFLFTGPQFVLLLQDEEASNRFFKDIRNEKFPTVFVVDQADNLFKLESDAEIRALEKFRALTSNRDHKIMFLFATEVPIESIEDKAFLSRMNYKIKVTNPGPEELKKILLQQSKRLLKGPILGAFTPQMCEDLANTIFEGKTGREVESAIMSLDLNGPLCSKEELYNHFNNYFL